MDWGGCPIKFWIWGGMDLDPGSWGGLELRLKIGPVKTSMLKITPRFHGHLKASLKPLSGVIKLTLPIETPVIHVPLSGRVGRTLPDKSYSGLSRVDQTANGRLRGQSPRPGFAMIGPFEPSAAAPDVLYVLHNACIGAPSVTIHSIFPRHLSVDAHNSLAHFPNGDAPVACWLAGG